MIRNILIAIMIFGAIVVNASRQAHNAVLDVVEFEQIPKRSNTPIMIAFYADWCAYCDIMKSEILEVMANSKQYNNIVVVKVNIDISDLDEKYNVGMVPVIIFVDHNGNELSERIIGVPTIDFYWQFVDEGINTAIRKMEKQP